MRILKILSRSTRLSDIHGSIMSTLKNRHKRRKSQEGEMRVENDRANEILIAFRNGERIQEFMDAVSGVEGYRLDNIKRQGNVRSQFAKELIADQFLLNIDDIISIFWQGVFEHVDKAKLHGDLVEIKGPGKSVKVRPTKNNPIHYLRYHGQMAVRNYITSLYRKNLQQGCSTCGHTISTTSNKQCPKCGAVMSTVYKFDAIDEDIDNLQTPQAHAVESKDIERRFNDLLKDFGEMVLKPGTRAYQVLKILTEPSASKEMCKACNLCPAKTFDIDSCTNYNANIGHYLGVSKTMIAGKVRRIRQAFPEYLVKEGSEESVDFVRNRIPKKFRSLEVIQALEVLES